jgi:hypothetical protein
MRRDSRRVHLGGRRSAIIVAEGSNPVETARLGRKVDVPGRWSVRFGKVSPAWASLKNSPAGREADE